ncbi:MAG: hypothetical protein ACD_71C00094G0001 [uncultured bacterium (gcode 4)]|uniref:Uncharacterized protein n=1 Tax=uncultured bacterium (gcode 4) TaxID=1234023 RepID=K1YNN5_9BACT|nr:MAG: hypothetical protein ACD_71C00094G0001 [uncultured bacterium (gcode 4)]
MQYMLSEWIIKAFKEEKLNVANFNFSNLLTIKCNMSGGMIEM